ncbi:solute carrier family 49 member 4 homolog isoform X2 [Panulirus ornatus]
MTRDDLDENSVDSEQFLVSIHHERPNGCIIIDADQTQENGGFCVGSAERQRPTTYGSVEDVDTESLLSKSDVVAPTTTLIRFWILFVFSVLCWTHGLQWETWGPISESVHAAIPGWGPSTVAMMSNWGTIMFTIFILPMCWVTMRCGLRAAVIIAASFMFVGTALRCIPTTTTIFTVMCHLCAILMGISSTILLAAPLLIAANWFPLNERTTAVAVMMGASELGGVGSYLEPLLVHLPSQQTTTSDIREEVMTLMYIDLGMTSVLLLTVLLYFPSKPPHPPSLTSSSERLSFIPGLKSLAKNKRFLVLLVAYGIAIGPPIAWITIINYSLLPLGLHQNESMWIGISAVIASSLSPVISGRINDNMQGHIKTLVTILMLATAGCFYWFLLLTYEILPLVKWQVYVSVIGGTAFNFATIPLLFEVAIDLAYPVPEILVSGVITAADNIASVSFLLVFFIPDVGYKWMSYTLVLSTSLTLVPILFIPFDYTRSKIDTFKG